MSGFDDPVDEKRIRDSIAARMPLERPEKPVETFLGGESYHPTSQDTKRTSEAARVLSGEYGLYAKQRYENMKERIEPTPHQIIMGSGITEDMAWRIVGRLKERGWIIVKEEDEGQRLRGVV